MCKIKIHNTSIDGLVLIEPKVFNDERGYFYESYNMYEFEKVGLNIKFVQDNQSRSSKGVIRGLHFQEKHPQGKFVNVTVGEVFDVAVDLRKESLSFGKWYGQILTAQNKIAMYIPEGFAHGFLVLSEFAEFTYKCTDYYYPDEQKGIIWNDPDISISWPLQKVKKILLSKKDEQLPRFRDYCKI